MSARRLGILLGAVVALFIALSGGGGARVLAPARAEDPTTEPTLASTLPPTTRAPTTEPPPPTEPPPTQPDISTDSSTPSPTNAGHRTTTTSRHGSATTISSDTTEVVAGATETTLSPDTTVTVPTSTTPRTAARVALPSTHDDNSSNTGKLLALLLGGLGLSGVAFAGVRATTRRRRAPYESNYAAPMVLPPLFGQTEPETETAPQVDWAPLWDGPGGEETAATTTAVPVESARARRKRERRERFHEEHDHVDPDEALAALAASTPLPAPQVDWSSEPEPEPELQPEPEPEPAPEPEPPRQVADPYEDLDLSAPADLDPGIPDMHIDLSDPEL